MSDTGKDRAETPLEGFTLKSNYPYLMGVYLAVNAIPDAWLVVDGPDCASYKSQFIHGRHDLMSTLVDCAGNDRIRPTDVTVTGIIGDRSEAIARQVRALDGNRECSVVLLASLPMAAITGTQYDLILRKLGPDTARPLVEVPSLSLQGDWLDGYAETLAALAGKIELEGTGPQPGKVAVVGYFMERNERDHGANVEEIERLIRSLGIEPVSVWASGRPVSHLARAGEAELVVSLPNGRKAAACLAARTGARVVETGVPLGLGGTALWLAQVAEAVGREEAAERFVEAELGKAVRRIQWLIPRYFLGTRALFVGIPHYFEPMVEFLDELGVRVAALVAVGRREHLVPLPPAVADRGIPAAFQPNPFELMNLVSALPGDLPFELAIQSGTFGWSAREDLAVVPFGFATPQWHAIHDSPFLGFSGALCLVHRMAEQLMALRCGRR